MSERDPQRLTALLVLVLFGLVAMAASAYALLGGRAEASALYLIAAAIAFSAVVRTRFR